MGEKTGRLQPIDQPPEDLQIPGMQTRQPGRVYLPEADSHLYTYHPGDMS